MTLHTVSEQVPTTVPVAVPNSTAVAPARFVPAIVTSEPPAVEPVAGETDVTDTGNDAVPTTTFPHWSPATHSSDDGHEMFPRMYTPSTFVVVHAPAPPVGSVRRHHIANLVDRYAERHRRARNAVEGGGPVDTRRGPHVDPAGGVGDVTASPFWSTAAHSDTDGHDTPIMKSVSVNVCHGPRPGPAGRVGGRHHIAVVVDPHAERNRRARHAEWAD